MLLSLEGWLAGAACVVLLLPTVVLWRAFARLRSRRLLLAALGFSSFLATDLTVVVVQAVGPALSDALEWLEFAGDIATAALFTAAFLLAGPVRE